MARAAARLAENAQGEFYVDSSCIDCETCRIVAPTVFARDDRIGMSIVRRQPGGEDETLRATMALVACPTSSIGSVSKVDVGPAVAAFPEPLDGNVYYCGFASEESFGAASYFVKRDAGNVLVDSPRAARPLLERIDALGGVATMLLSHRDDVADHAKYARRFACKRTMHAADIDSDTANVELRIDGSAPVALADDLVVIPVPGHTRGSVALVRPPVPLHRGSPLGRRRRLGTRRLPQRLLVLVGQANPLDGDLARLRLRMGSTRPRASRSRAPATDATDARAAHRENECPVILYIRINIDPEPNPSGIS